MPGLLFAHWMLGKILRSWAIFFRLGNSSQSQSHYPITKLNCTRFCVSYSFVTSTVSQRVFREPELANASRSEDTGILYIKLIAEGSLKFVRIPQLYLCALKNQNIIATIVRLPTTFWSLHSVANWDITHNMYSKSMLSNHESPMSRGRRHPLQKTYSYESDYTYRSATSNYEEKYRSFLKYYIDTDPRKNRDHIPSNLRESLWRPRTSRSSTFPIIAEEKYIRQPRVRYVKPTTARGLGSMAYYADAEYEPYENSGRVRTGEH